MELVLFQVRNYKSIKLLKLEEPPNLVVFVGSNNAGKSNVFDVLNFLREAGDNIGNALANRGGDFSEIVRDKRSDIEISIILQFRLPDHQRRDLIDQLFAQNQIFRPSAAAETPFLRTLTYSLTASQGVFTEDLWTESTLTKGTYVAIARAVFGEQRREVQTAPLAAGCQHLRPERPMEARLEEKVRGGGGFENGLCFRYAPGAPMAPHAEYFTDLVRDELMNTRWLSPVRRSVARQEARSTQRLSSEAGNLAAMMHTLRNNNPALFAEIELEMQHLVPGIGSFSTPIQDNETTLAVQEKDAPPELFFTLNQMSQGTRTAIAIVTYLASAEPGSWVCIEEPETHLHPKAQAALLAFIRRQAKDKRIFITTHSSVIASHAPMDSLFLTARDSDNGTVVDAVDESNVERVIEELGVRPSFAFEADAVVFVEGEWDVPVYEAWANRLRLRHVQFIDTESWNKMDYYASAKILRTKRLEVSVFVIFDGDTERSEEAKKTKQRVVQALQLPKGHALTLEVSEVEGHLLDASAMKSAFPGISLSDTELASKLAPIRKKRDQKGRLDRLFRELGIGRYDGEKGARIARKMQKIPEEVEVFFAVVKTGT